LKIGDLSSDGKIPNFHLMQKEKKEKQQKTKASNYRLKKKYPEYIKKQIDICICGCTRGNHSTYRCSRSDTCGCQTFVFHHSESFSIRMRKIIYKPVFDVNFDFRQVYPKEEIHL